MECPLVWRIVFACFIIIVVAATANNSMYAFPLVRPAVAAAAASTTTAKAKLPVMALITTGRQQRRRRRRRQQPRSPFQRYSTTTAVFSSSSSSQKKHTALQEENYPPPPSPFDFGKEDYAPRDYFRFEILHQSKKSLARVGRIHTPHGIIDTPGYVAVATNGALKGVDFRTVDAGTFGQQLVFANTYHLMLHPGADTIAAAGGIHEWTARTDRPFITDSGGFQVFSLLSGSVQEDLKGGGGDGGGGGGGATADGGGGELKRSSGKRSKHKKTMGNDAVKISEDGVTFRSYRDGSKFLLTPESTVQAQKKIGADIIIPLDELPGYYVNREAVKASMERTHRWEARSLQEHLKDKQQQAMYCVIHGGIDQELRRESLNYLTSLPFDGYAIGGSLGGGRQELKELLQWMMPLFNENNNGEDGSTTSSSAGDRSGKPRHLLGIADEENIRNAVANGIDTMDSCYPTRVGRHGTLMTSKGLIKIKSGKFRNQFGVKIDEDCQCATCQHYDRAYLWHLFKAKEPIAVTLAAQHNLHYVNKLMQQLRQDIMDDKI